LSGLFGMRAAVQGDGLDKAIAIENQIYQKKVEAGAIKPDEHKRSPESGH
jgi:hypothetical protein